MKKTLVGLMFGALFASNAISDNINSLSSDFSKPDSLESWHDLRPEGFSNKWRLPRVENGRLILRPKSSGWFEDQFAGHLYKQVDGDFIVTIRLEVTGKKSKIPQKEFSLAGIFIRSPREVSAENWRPGGENWLFFSTGTAAPAGEPHYEIKTTTNSLSTLKILPSQAGMVELRIARYGEQFNLLAKPEGKEWTVVDQILRPDLPRTLNVGMTAYSDYSSVVVSEDYNISGAVQEGADLIAYIESIDFRRPSVPRIPVLNIDAPEIFPEISARKNELLSD